MHYIFLDQSDFILRKHCTNPDEMRKFFILDLVRKGHGKKRILSCPIWKCHWNFEIKEWEEVVDREDF